jgi:hypothetical protein
MLAAMATTAVDPGAGERAWILVLDPLVAAPRRGLRPGYILGPRVPVEALLPARSSSLDASLIEPGCPYPPRVQLWAAARLRVEPRQGRYDVRAWG